ncbi:MAG: malto-oligosyltrehalose synthase [Geodermatophilaceae bacterium]|nr:malto-oligosyltrehalose synthase [Geodermatophilaceae bacterium]
MSGSAPLSTYRLQISAAFTMQEAAGIVDYLRELGVSHAYSSPLLAATPGSTHGYDTVDFASVDEERGGVEGFAAFDAALRAHGLGLILDIVPNHMGVGVPDVNPWWWDVLRYGRYAEHAPALDVDWDFGNQRLRIPVLADSPYALDDLQVEFGELRYHDHRYPLAADGDTEGGTPQEVHERQRYELMSWRRADTDLNYRRFFAINDLAAVRVEQPAVFDAVHALVLGWVESGAVAGLRVDHPDGLADPGGYLKRLAEAAPQAWLVVEKILHPGEVLPTSWPVAGTTGYDALNEVGGVFVDPAGEEVLTALDTELSGQPVDFLTMIRECKRAVADGILHSEVRRLARLVPDLDAAEDALAEMLACFPVYRSYLPDGAAYLQQAADYATASRPDLAQPVALLRDRLLVADSELAIRFQQTSGMVMAKGVEDTAYYRWNRFAALNEVGGDPIRFGWTTEQFHAACALRQERSPDGMTTLSTHDTKRSEDVRARLAVLAEIPEAWATVVRRWDEAAPLADRPLAHMLWQNIVGAWPLDRDRAHAYAQKAAREAGVSTTWADPDEDFEVRLHAMVDVAFDDPELGVELVVDRIKKFGWSNSLGMKLIQLMMPGVPDVYQGTEIWDHSLVDPDNRRRVDFDHLRALLLRVDDGWLPPLDATGAAKLLVVSRALRVRAARPLPGYQPLSADGPATDHLVAFDRGGVIALATRLPLRLAAAEGWGQTVLDLPPGEWSDAITGMRYDGGTRLVAGILHHFPVALLVAG